MATTEEIDTVETDRLRIVTVARDRGHDLRWTTGRNSLRKGCPYHKVGRCRDCGAQVTVDAAGVWCAGDKDAREVQCEQTLVEVRA